MDIELDRPGVLPQESQTVRVPRNRNRVADLFHLKVRGGATEEMLEVLSPAALLFVEELEAHFGERRRQLLELRRERAGDFDFPNETEEIRAGTWKASPPPADLLERQIEITGPVDAKTIINALNSGADVFMADFEDATSPKWENVVLGQLNLKNAIRRQLVLRNAAGKDYRLGSELATLTVRPRGWQSEEKHILFDGEPVSAALVDFGLFFFHNAHELVSRGSGPYFYLPKLESYLEARLWNDVFEFAQARMGLSIGTIRATAVIETVSAALEMDEILYELRDHAVGLSAGRWGYLASAIKSMPVSSPVIFPDRAALTMSLPFMQAFCRRLVSVCHRRGVHAIGGVSVFVPSRLDPSLSERAYLEVRADKQREVDAGFDGTWIAHPDLLSAADDVFSKFLSPRPHQKEMLAEGAKATDLLPTALDGRVTSAGVSRAISVTIQYVSSWLQGQGVLSISGQMEDASTADLARTLLWHWVNHGVVLEDGVKFTREEFRRRLESERARFAGQAERGRLSEACEILESAVLSPDLIESLTLPAYQRL